MTRKSIKASKNPEALAVEELADLLQFPELAQKHIGLFESGGMLAIQRIDESCPEDYSDEDAIRDVVSLARQGNLEAIAILHLEGWAATKKAEIGYIAKLHGLQRQV